VADPESAAEALTGRQNFFGFKSTNHQTRLPARQVNKSKNNLLGLIFEC